MQSETLHLQLRELLVAGHLSKRNWLSDKQPLSLQIKKAIEKPVTKVMGFLTFTAS